MTDKNIQDRLEYLRGEIRKECISYGEIAELQSLADHIADDDVELLQWAGVPEGARDVRKVHCKYCGHVQDWRLADLIAENSDIESLDDAIEYDQCYICKKCGCLVRIGEALEQPVQAAQA